MELSLIKGIGPKTITKLNKLNIYNLDDLIRYYPYRYNIYRPMNLDDEIDGNLVIVGTIVSPARVFYMKSNFNKISFRLETNNKLINVVIFNRAFLISNLKISSKITIIGKYDKFKNLFTASDIKLYPITKIEIESVYHTVSGVKLSFLRNTISSVLDKYDSYEELLPNYIIDKYKLLSEYDAIKEIHNPSSIDNLKKSKLKLIYEELFIFMFKINILRYKNQIFNDYIIKDIDDNYVNKLINELPFKLTNDQLNAIEEIKNDFKGQTRMNRLLLGDVGSGKTIVAFIAMMMNVKCGYQCAMLAPTEVLATQHYNNFIKLFPNIKCCLLVGSLKAKEKKVIKEKLKNNEIDVLIGTHAMLDDSVIFNNLGLVVTDEQHRFGVNQRKNLQNKGNNVDVLYASATPIPRTYALTIYGDMDISYIKEKPKGRKEIITKQYSMDEISEISHLIEEELNLHHQAYIVSSVIEDEETSELKDLKTIEKSLEENFKYKHNIGILHGKMSNENKEEVMNKFKNGELDVLISTTVIEVGVDVENATIIAIFNSERFGLATLHQLRGRVGRNSLQSKCLLISDKKSERLKVMEDSNDGFYISEKDFELRGSGDLFGTKQSGDMTFKIADIRRDFKILLQCKKDTEEFTLNNIENGFVDYPYYKDISESIFTDD